MGRLMQLGFSREEREFFARALEESSGPAHISNALAAFIGFADADSMVKRCEELANQVRQYDRIDETDLARSQLACEILFSSDIHGSGLDWEATSGFDDRDAIQLLRQIQVKMLNLRPKAP
ncbi:hypothetical protein [Glycomyces harbinensis]|uniref:Uncharacterized protein n=1 Tax=Glycomyces harbinensis TaxID=58114 RepID=A0A1G6SHR0_9ACTN|nr:hypothetical protein [Glycomyces harbinensis]SDD15675.1 hypothetical protein SAMN05216270_10273 [Glycomyces harbinensis]